MEKNFVKVIVILVIGTFLGVIFFYLLQQEMPADQLEQQVKIENNQAIGGQKDEHGCLPAAGYGWCAPKQKCIRFWEEKCDQTHLIEEMGRLIPELEKASELDLKDEGQTIIEWKTPAGTAQVPALLYTLRGFKNVDYKKIENLFPVLGYDKDPLNTTVDTIAFQSAIRICTIFKRADYVELKCGLLDKLPE